MTGVAVTVGSGSATHSDSQKTLSPLGEEYHSVNAPPGYGRSSAWLPMRWNAEMSLNSMITSGFTLITNDPTASHSTVAVSPAMRAAAERSRFGPSEKLTMLTGPIVRQKGSLLTLQPVSSPPIITK